MEVPELDDEPTSRLGISSELVTISKDWFAKPAYDGVLVSAGAAL
jgi:hypothetical protein